MKKSKFLPLIVIPMLVACGSGIPEDEQRDVYTKLEDCVADWGDKELCLQMAQEDQQAAGLTQNPDGSFFFFGPMYSPSMGRYIEYDGRTVRPNTSRSTIKPMLISQTRSLSAKSSTTASGKSISRGGFGASARSSGGG